MQSARLFLLLAASAIAFGQSSSHAPVQAPSAEDRSSSAVWQMQDSGTTAGLRGIDSVDGTVAWASGTGGTVLKTIDGGGHWQRCTIPDADKDGVTLDFRGVQAWDATTAIVMASGPGDKSRLYKTRDGCKTWEDNLRNDDPNGFWDVMQFVHSDFGFAIAGPNTGVLIGDPVEGQFKTNAMMLGYGWFLDTAGCKSEAGEAAFAASNSSAFEFGNRRYILGTGGKAGAAIHISALLYSGDGGGPCKRIAVPMAGDSDSSGVFSVFFKSLKVGVIVGGDYTEPNESKGTAARTSGDWNHWTASTTPPHGYRSTVQWSEPFKLWITAGTNGSDISRDDGRTWHPLDNGNWNALSLPFIVGPNGRIARLNPAAIPKP
jgi:photosystem II stability/assembly factor-like uncharacterized protein